MRKLILIAAAIAISACSIAMTVTKAKYDAITEGMSYSQVVAIIGQEGEEQSRSKIGDLTSVSYSWKNSTGSNMFAIFQNDKMTMKAQYGLR